MRLRSDYSCRIILKFNDNDDDNEYNADDIKDDNDEHFDSSVDSNYDDNGDAMMVLIVIAMMKIMMMAMMMFTMTMTRKFMFAITPKPMGPRVHNVFPVRRPSGFIKNVPGTMTPYGPNNRWY